MDRRSFLRGASAVCVSGVASLSGCQSKPAAEGPYVPAEPNYQGWFQNVSNYRGTVDSRGESQERIDVGVQGANGYYYYGPAAVAVSPGTEVTWEWTGRGGTHNVLSTSGAFTSGQVVDDAGHTFSQTFTDPGVYRYFCSPHQSLGMKGAVFVALGQRGGPG